MGQWPEQEGDGRWLKEPSLQSSVKAEVLPGPHRIWGACSTGRVKPRGLLMQEGVVGGWLSIPADSNGHASPEWPSHSPEWRVCWLRVN